jgi:hypothetical protein
VPYLFVKPKEEADVADNRMLFRAGAFCAGASAVTTFLLLLLPRLYEAANGFDESVRLHAEPL